jgi:RND family efflux transporter MFP subunit
LEQDKIDVTRATPVANTGTTSAKRRSGAPLWLQVLLSLIVIAIAVGIFGLFNPTANSLVRRVGIALPMLNAPADAQAQTQTAAAPAGQGGQQAAQGQGGGQRQGQGGAGGRQGGAGGNRAAIVVTQPVRTGIINNQLTAIGESSALRSVTVSSSSGGTLMTVDVKPGDKVQAGAKLATLDSDTQQNAFDKAKLAAQDADAALARAQTLAKSNSVSQTQLDAAELAAAQAKLAQQAAQIALDQRTITTPVAGTVGLIQVMPGNLISPQTVVTTVDDSSEILINFWVPERYSSQMAIGTALTATSAALPGKTFNGVITAVDNKIDPASRTLQVQATLPNPDGLIKSGMSFSVDMTFPGETFPAVDPLSIQWSNNGAYVWKVLDNKAVKGMVDIVQRNSDGVLVKGDVKPGDAVVTQGVLQLNDNMAVRLLDQAAAATVGQGQGQGQGGGQQGAQAAQSGGGQAASQPAQGQQGQGGQGSGNYKKRQGQQGASQASSAATGG